MKKRLLSIVLALALILSAMPVTVFAAESDTVTFTAIDGTAGNSGESYNNIFDGKNSGNNSTKWCVQKHTSNTFVVIKASSTAILESYTFITGNDTASHSGRNPKAWTVYGSNDYDESAKTGTWTALHTVANGEMPAENYASKTFTVNKGAAYKYFKLVISEIVSTENNTLFQLCGISLTATASEPSADFVCTAIDGTAGVSNENYTNLFDGKNSSHDYTKWCVENFSSGTYVVIKPQSSGVLTGYTFITGNDTAAHPDRNPKSWTVYGSNNYDESTKTGDWTAVHTVTNGEMPAENFASKAFNVESSTPYKYFKIVINEVGSTDGTAFLQLCGMVLTGRLEAVEEPKENITDYSVGETFEFGYYPQSRVTDESVIASLNTLANVDSADVKTSTSVNNGWTSYNYYSGTGSSDNGQMTAGDYMRYIDIVYNGGKYRGVVFDSYRPSYTGYDHDDRTYQNVNGYSAGAVYWFKFEPITWRVLDPANGLVMSETILDSQAFNNYVLCGSDGEYYGDSAKTYEANDYAESSIREWLNDDFYNTAFSASQKNIIAETTLDNSAYSTSYSKYDSQSTTDRVFLLSYSDLIKEDYGFSLSYSEYDADRRAEGTDYAKSQGLWVSASGDSAGKSSWRLRSAGSSSGVACEVGNGGTLNSTCKTDNVSSGTRPALKLSTTASIIQSEDNVANYTVEAYTMDTSGVYVLTKSKLLGGVGETVEAKYTVPTGFTLNEANSVLSGEITLDGSLVLKVYLDRNKYKLTTVVGGGSAWTEYYYGQTVAAVADPEKRGYEFDGWDKEIPETMPAEDLTVTAKWKDVTAPTGEIKVGTSSWKTFVNNITFGLFFKNTQEVTITANDNSGEAVTIEYLLSDKELTEAELASKAFTAYNGQFNIDPNNEYVIYAKLTDTSGNVTKINSSGIVLDDIAPVISGVSSGETYCAAQTVTVSDRYDVTVTVNGEPVTLANGSFTLSTSLESQRIVAKDQAGNTSAEITVTVNDGHTYDWHTENGKYWGVCRYCDHETAKNNIPEVTITGADRVCKTQNYTFTITPSSGITNVRYGYEFSSVGDSQIAATFENGIYSGTVLSNMYDTDTSFRVTASAVTDDGYTVSTSKIVQILSQHTGGTGTCTGKAKCEVCGAEYGNVNPDNHAGEKEWTTKNATQHEQKWSCCGVTTVELENHEWEGGVCKDCGYVCTHTGGTADCKHKAKCEACGVEYGNVNPDNHTGEKEWTTKNATQHEQKWNCCGAIAVALENHEWEGGVCKDCGAVNKTPVTSASFTLDTSTYATDKKIVDVKVSGTNTGLESMGSEGSGYADENGFYIGMETGDSFDETYNGFFVGGVNYILAVRLIAQEGYTLEYLAKENIKLNSTLAAYKLVLDENDATKGVAYFKLDQLPLIPITAVNFDLQGFAVGSKVTDSVLGMQFPSISSLYSVLDYHDSSVAATKSYYLIGTDYDESNQALNGIYDTSLEFAANTTYYLGVVMFPEDGYSFEGLTKENIKLGNATAFDLIRDSSTAYVGVIFKLSQLTENSDEEITSASFTLDASTYDIGKKIVDLKVSGTNDGLLTIGTANTAYYYGFVIADSNLNHVFGANSDDVFAADTTYYLLIVLVPQEGYSIEGLSAECVTLNGAAAEDLLRGSGSETAVARFKLPKLSSKSVNFTLDMSTYAIGKNIVDIKVSGTNNGLADIGATDTGYDVGFVVTLYDEPYTMFEPESVETFAADTSYSLFVKLIAQEGYSLADLTIEDVTLNSTITAYDLRPNENKSAAVACFKLPKLSAASVTPITAVDFALDGYNVGNKVTESKLVMSVTPNGALTSPAEYFTGDATPTTTCFVIFTMDESAQDPVFITEASATFESGVTYYLYVIMILKDGYSFDGLTKEKVKLGSLNATRLSVTEDGMAVVIFELPQLSADSVNFTLDMNTYAIGKKILDVKVSGMNNGLVTIGDRYTGYGDGFVISESDLNSVVQGNSDKTFAAATDYYLGIVLGAAEGYSLSDLTKEHITLNNTITAFDFYITPNDDTLGIACFKLPELSTGSVNNITAVDFTLGGYALGNKVTETTLSMSVTPNGALTSPAEYFTGDATPTTTCFVIFTKDESAQDPVPIMDSYATFESGVTYYIEIAMIPKAGYNFGGLTKEKVKLGSLTAIELAVTKDGMAVATFRLPTPTDYSWYTSNTSATEFTITTVSQLIGFADLVNGTNGQTATDFEGKTVKLGANLDLSVVANWTPIGMDENHQFKGTFDGNGKKISNLTINSNAYIVGLFGVVNCGTVKNLDVSGNVTCVAGVSSSNYILVGGIVGEITDGSIENCSFSGSVTASEADCIGGIVGLSYGEISGCSNFASVSGNGFNAGGIAGYAGNIRYCYNQGRITTAKDYAAVGGIAGEIESYSEIATVYSCYSTGAVSATGENSYVGGAVGYIHPDKADVIIDKVYYLDSVAAKGVGELYIEGGKNVTDNTTARTADEFASGEVAYLLQKSVSAKTTTDEAGNEVITIPLVWGQRSSTDGSAPILTSNEDYRVLPVMQDEAVVNYSVLHKGDVNFDGVVDIYDYQLSVNIALSESNTRAEAEKYDLNGDGVYDVLDCSIAERQGMSSEAYNTLMQKALASEPAYRENADFESDGAVDVLDVCALERLLSGHRVCV